MLPLKICPDRVPNSGAVFDSMLPRIRIKLVLVLIDRLVEVLAGVIMVLTFTNALSVSHAGKSDPHAMLIGSLGCNLAWGIIGGIMYLMNCLAAGSHRLDTLRAMRGASDPETERIPIAELPEELAGEVCSVELAPIIRRVRELPTSAPSRALPR
jgi:hypothetical protein